MPVVATPTSMGHIGGTDNDSSAGESNLSESTAESAKSVTKSASEIGKALKQARQEARRLQMRIKLPALLIGSLLMGSSMWWVYTSWTPRAASNMFVRDVLRSLGCIAWLCHCLPTDRWAPKIGCALLFILGVKCAWWHTDNAVQYFIDHSRGEGCEIEGEQTDCWLGAFTILAQTVLYVAMHLWQLPYLLKGMFLPPRVTMSRQWVALALLHFTKGASDFLVILPAVAIRALHSGAVPWAVVVFSTLHGVYAIVMGFALISTKVRQWVHFTLLSKSGALTVSSSIAAFIGSKSAQQIIELSMEACRSVSLDKVLKEDMLRSTPDPALQAHARSCRLQDIDAFLTHSWHDPAEAKWDALQSWRAKFKQQHQREPRLWIDKYCIDQENIDASLMCLPVYLAGCHTLLIIAGPTYLSRLWCVEEVFVYLQMGRPVDSMELYSLSPELGGQISSFDVRNAQCSKEVDRQTLLATIEAGCDGFEAFNAQVRRALELVMKSASRV